MLKSALCEEEKGMKFIIHIYFGIIIVVVQHTVHIQFNVFVWCKTIITITQ